MCDPVLIAAILEELGYLDGREEKEKKTKPMMSEKGNKDR
jgi:hypothetical protein